MTEVPEHLLRRSRERREALGLGGGEPSGEAPAERAAPAEEGAAPPAPPAARAPAPADPLPEPEPPPPPPPPAPHVEAAMRRRRIPIWVSPVLVCLPLWALVYAGTMAAEEGPADPILAEGEEIYAGQCASCHGAEGGGGVGPELAGGSVLQTFPDREAHIEWVLGGSNGVGVGNPYGSADRPGGQRVVEGGMPAFEGELSEEQVLAVVRYEREVLSGEAAESASGPEGEAGQGGSGGEAEGGGEGTEPQGSE